MSDTIMGAYSALTQGYNACKKENYEEAILHLESAVGWYNKARQDGEQPGINYSVAYVNLALSYYKKKDYSKAIDTCNDAIKNGPGISNFYTHKILGLSYLHKSADIDDKSANESAITALSKALKIGNNDFEVHYNLGIAHKRNGDFPNATEAFKKSLGCLPNHNMMMKSHHHIVSCAKQGTSELHDALQKAYKYISDNQKLLLPDHKDKIKSILEHYAKSCISFNTKDSAEIAKIEELYKQVCSPSKPLWEVLRDDMYVRYNNGEEQLGNLLTQIGHVVKNSKAAGVFEGMKVSTVTLASQSPQYAKFIPHISDSVDGVQLASSLLGKDVESNE